jgi:cardiolipin synthase
MRIALVVPILMSILEGSFVWALALFWLAGFSDGLDGYLAKRFNWHTRLGALLDPVADKLLVAGLFVTLAYTGDLPVWLAATVILRDIIIVIGATAYNFLVQPVQGEPTRVSKLNTALQLLFLLFVISRAGFGWPEEISITVLGASVLTTVVISGVDYVWSWSRRAQRGE